ncbi:MAG: hypothetical protein KKG47_03155 [Proteobacteria bacterium]|nr:hypothetical protein [Pseudomonadota bacterium]MBU1738892.1 hypothetical protein [Pseudomonadota bacterium]
MLNGKELCNKITQIYPDIGACGINLDVQYDDGKEAWMVDLSKNHHHLQTRLEMDEAEKCLAGKQCVSLGIQVSQLVNNIDQL